jgi:hypothetical protein
LKRRRTTSRRGSMRERWWRRGKGGEICGCVVSVTANLKAAK